MVFQQMQFLLLCLYTGACHGYGNAKGKFFLVLETIWVSCNVPFL